MSDQPTASTSTAGPSHGSAEARGPAGERESPLDPWFDCVKCKRTSIQKNKPHYYLPCLHVLCHSCFDMFRVINAGAVECPSCRKVSNKDTIFDDFTYEEERTGCQRTGCPNPSPDNVIVNCETCRKYLCEPCYSTHDRSHKFQDSFTYIPMASRCSVNHTPHRVMSNICGCGKRLCDACTRSHNCGARMTAVSDLIARSTAYMTAIADNDRKIFGQYQKIHDALQNRRREILSVFHNNRTALSIQVVKYASLLIQRFQHIVDHLDGLQRSVLTQLSNHEMLIGNEMKKFSDLVRAEHQIATVRPQNAIPFFSFIKTASSYAAECSRHKNYNIETHMPMVNVKVEAKPQEFVNFLSNFGEVHINSIKTTTQSNFDTTKLLFDMMPKMNPLDVQKPTGFVLRALSGGQYKDVDMEQIRRKVKQIKDPEELRDRCSQLEAEVTYYKRLTLELENQLKERQGEPSKKASTSATTSSSSTPQQGSFSRSNSTNNGPAQPQATTPQAQPQRNAYPTFGNQFRQGVPPPTAQVAGQLNRATAQPPHQPRRVQARPPANFNDPSAMFPHNQSTTNKHQMQMAQNSPTSPFSMISHGNNRMPNSPLVNSPNRVPFMPMSPAAMQMNMLPRQGISPQHLQQLCQIQAAQRMQGFSPQMTMNSPVVNHQQQQMNSVPRTMASFASTPQQGSPAYPSVVNHFPARPTPPAAHSHNNGESQPATPSASGSTTNPRSDVVEHDPAAMEVETSNGELRGGTGVDMTVREYITGAPVVRRNNSSVPGSSQSGTSTGAPKEALATTPQNGSENSTTNPNGQNSGTKDKSAALLGGAAAQKEATRSASVPQMPAGSSNQEIAQQNSPAATIEHSKKHKRHRTDEFQQASSSKTSTSGPQLRIRLENNENRGSGPNLVAVQEPPRQQQKADESNSGVLKTDHNEGNASTNSSKVSPDDWDDYCFVCSEGCDQKTGTLGCCATCPRVFHQLCHLPPCETRPEDLPDDWRCTMCVPSDPVREAIENIDNNALLACAKVVLACFEDQAKIEYFRKPEMYMSHLEGWAKMDLINVANRLGNRKYTSIPQFLEEVNEVFRACSKYNPPTSAIEMAGRDVYNAYYKAVRQHLPAFAKEVWMWVNLHKNEVPRKKRRLNA